jgi:hypothetical protein
LDCPIVVSSVSRLFQGLSLYIYICICILYICTYTTTIGQQKSQNTTALPSSLKLCATVYTMKNILYRLYIIIYGLLKLTVVTGLPFAVFVSKNWKPMTLVEVSERHSSPLFTSQPSMLHVDTWIQRDRQFATTAAATVLWPTYTYSLSYRRAHALLYYIIIIIIMIFFLYIFSNIFTQCDYTSGTIYII